MPKNLPNNISAENMPNKMSENIPENIPNRMPQDIPNKIPEDLPDNIPEDILNRMAEDLPDRMSEDMSDRMPEDLSIRKCINVMVGITRRKIILNIFFLIKGLFPLSIDRKLASSASSAADIGQFWLGERRKSRILPKSTCRTTIQLHSLYLKGLSKALCLVTASRTEDLKLWHLHDTNCCPERSYRDHVQDSASLNSGNNSLLCG